MALTASAHADRRRPYGVTETGRRLHRASCPILFDGVADERRVRLLTWLEAQRWLDEGITRSRCRVCDPALPTHLRPIR